MRQTKLNSHQENAINTFVHQTKQKRNLNLVESLSSAEITQIQQYLEQVKISKGNLQNMQNTQNMQNNSQQYDRIFDNGMRSNATMKYVDRDFISDDRMGSTTRIGKKSDSYYNPYEYGAKQNVMPSPLSNTPYLGAYEQNYDLGMPDNFYKEKFPGYVRNVNVESSLMQSQATHLPGQREIMERERNRFEDLPFNPQDPNHIVWKDNMPRGGISTRNDYLESK